MPARLQVGPTVGQQATLDRGAFQFRGFPHSPPRLPYEIRLLDSGRFRWAVEIPSAPKSGVADTRDEAELAVLDEAYRFAQGYMPS